MPVVLWFGIVHPEAGGFFPAFTDVIQDIGDLGLAAAASTTAILEGAQALMVIYATILKPLQEKRERERAEWRAKVREEIRAEVREEARAEVSAAWTAWNGRREAAEARGEPFDEPPPSDWSGA